MHLIAVILSDFIPLLCTFLSRIEFSVSSKTFFSALYNTTVFIDGIYGGIEEILKVLVVKIDFMCNFDA